MSIKSGWGLNEAGCAAARQAVRAARVRWTLDLGGGLPDAVAATRRDDPGEAVS
ncbi:hypothetical protein [Burkholderia stagnalis]|uniref:hypothetical protein n=1 Tax=Burkholderia stagnalis TaxID=1503054 RepID=UPI0013DEEACE|nr:hypothetical protein [Burkholderia stagnalis]